MKATKQEGSRTQNKYIRVFKFKPFTSTWPTVEKTFLNFILSYLSITMTIQYSLTSVYVNRVLFNSKL